jgi:hypothetical protein
MTSTFGGLWMYNRAKSDVDKGAVVLLPHHRLLRLLQWRRVGPVERSRVSHRARQFSGGRDDEHLRWTVDVQSGQERRRQGGKETRAGRCCPIIDCCGCCNGGVSVPSSALASPTVLGSSRSSAARFADSGGRDDEHLRWTVDVQSGQERRRQGGKEFASLRP